jgi:hypothetical protein
MGSVRLRFTGFELPDGWIELRRLGALSMFGHPDRLTEVSIAMFPVAPGVTMDLPTLAALSRERQDREDKDARTLPLGETSWVEDSRFCVASRVRRGSNPALFFATWTVSDGVYVLEAGSHDVDEAHFRLGAAEWDTVMRNLRFERPS